MTITAYLPRLGLFDRPARKPRHRAVDEVERLNQEKERLRLNLGWADALIATQRVQLDDADRKLAGERQRRKIAERQRDQAEAVIRLRDQRIADLEHRLEIWGLAEAAAAQTQEIPIPVITPVLPLHQAPMAKTEPAT
ncbi:hypothetical protein [Streptomyces sp. NPDC050564]|uniref:hypothetical protein n=1 Tax=Streptomyces sp. NPDC050564 TaxID=3365631 RepID=UPI00379A4E62